MPVVFDTGAEKILLDMNVAVDILIQERPTRAIPRVLDHFDRLVGIMRDEFNGVAAQYAAAVAALGLAESAIPFPFTRHPTVVDSFEHVVNRLGPVMKNS